eukprot:Rmarinus@m.946
MDETPGGSLQRLPTLQSQPTDESLRKAGNMKVYSKSLFQELVLSEDPSGGEPYSADNLKEQLSEVPSSNFPRDRMVRQEDSMLRPDDRRSRDWSPNARVRQETSRRLTSQSSIVREGSRKWELLEEKRIQKEKDYQARMEAVKRDSIRKAQEKRERREAKFLEDFKAFLEEKEGFVEDMFEYAYQKDMADKRKQETLFMDWEQKVFNHIQSQVADQLRARSTRSIAHRRQDSYQKFLTTTNEKAGLFRDIIIESDYDPFEPKRFVIKYKVSDSDDPVKIEIMKNLSEASTFGATRANRGRYVLDVQMWDKLEATPHGHFAEMFQRECAEHPIAAKLRRSNVYLDHYKVPRGAEVTDAEFPNGKRTFPNWKPGETAAQMFLESALPGKTAAQGGQNLKSAVSDKSNEVSKNIPPSNTRSPGNARIPDVPNKVDNTSTSSRAKQSRTDNVTGPNQSSPNDHQLSQASPNVPV